MKNAPGGWVLVAGKLQPFHLLLSLPGPVDLSRSAGLSGARGGHRVLRQRCSFEAPTATGTVGHPRSTGYLPVSIRVCQPVAGWREFSGGAGADLTPLHSHRGAWRLLIVVGLSRYRVSNRFWPQLAEDGLRGSLATCLPWQTEICSVVAAFYCLVVRHLSACRLAGARSRLTMLIRETGGCVMRQPRVAASARYSSMLARSRDDLSSLPHLLRRPWDFCLRDGGGASVSWAAEVAVRGGRLGKCHQPLARALHGAMASAGLRGHLRTFGHSGCASHAFGSSSVQGRSLSGRTTPAAVVRCVQTSLMTRARAVEVKRAKSQRASFIREALPAPLQ